MLQLHSFVEMLLWLDQSSFSLLSSLPHSISHLTHASLFPFMNFHLPLLFFDLFQNLGTKSQNLP